MDIAAYWLDKGIHGPSQEAFACYTKSIATDPSGRGIPEARFLRGCCYIEGRGTEASPALAFQDFWHAAQDGNTMAREYLGWCYLCGVGVPRNIEAAKKWLEPLARLGFGHSMYLLAMAHEQQGNPIYRRRWMRRASRHGHRAAMYTHGMEFYKKKRYGKALKWWKRGANAGHDYSGLRYAQLLLRLCPEATAHVKDVLKEVGLARAQFILARLYMCDGQGRQAYEVLKAVVRETDHPEAYYLLGVCANLGLGPKSGSIHQFYFFRLAARRGHRQALRACGICFVRGIGTGVNISRGLTMIRASQNVA